MRNKLAIFDMDGTLINTSLANYEAYKNASVELGLNWGVDYNRFKNEYFGKNYKIFLPDITGADRIICEKVHDLKTEKYESCLLKYASINNSLVDLIEQINNGYYIVLVTTASKKNTQKVMELFFKNIQFDYIVTSDDVEELKPNPEAWFKAMDHFGIQPQDTICFDDLEECILEAKKCLMNAFKVYLE